MARDTASSIPVWRIEVDGVTHAVLPAPSASVALTRYLTDTAWKYGEWTRGGNATAVRAGATVTASSYAPAIYGGAL